MNSCWIQKHYSAFYLMKSRSFIPSNSVETTHQRQTLPVPPTFTFCHIWISSDTGNPPVRNIALIYHRFPAVTLSLRCHCLDGSPIVFRSAQIHSLRSSQATADTQQTHCKFNARAFFFPRRATREMLRMTTRKHHTKRSTLKQIKYFCFTLRRSCL